MFEQYHSIVIPKSPDFKNGHTWYVDDDGGVDFTEIQDAINVAEDGDTVYVYSGIYKENLLLDKSIILIGEHKNTTIIESKPGVLPRPPGMVYLLQVLEI